MESAIQIPISKTKITIPARRPETITRPRLLEFLHEALDKKLTLLSAPAGYGKTSLLIHLAGESEIPLCWLSLDALDQEPQRFIAYLIASIAQRFPQFGNESFAALGNFRSMQEDGERIVVTVTNEIHDKIGEYFAIVLDDYHLVDPIEDIQQFIDRFLQLSGENCRLVLAARTLPALPNFHLMVARDEVIGLSFQELAFLPEEIQEYYARSTNLQIPMQMAQELAQETEGWITGINLIKSGALREKSATLKSIRNNELELFDYFGHEILDKQSPELRTFLLLTSVPNEFNVSLCTSVLAPLLPDEQINWNQAFFSVQSSNLFAFPVGAEGAWMRYHHIFRDFLQVRLREERPALFPKILYRLAETYQDDQEWERAHQIYQKLMDDESDATLIESAGSKLISAGRVSTLANWIDKLPVALIQRHPALLSLQGACAFILGDMQMGVTLLSEAESAFRQKKELDGLAQALVRRAVVYRDTGDYAHSLADAEEAISLTQSHSGIAGKRILGDAQRAKGLAYYRLGKLREATHWLEEALRTFSKIDDPAGVAIIQMELGITYRTLGNTRTAIDLYDKALAFWEQTENLGWQSTLLNNMGVLYHLGGEYEKAYTTLERSLVAAKRSGYIRVQALALSSLGDTLLDIQDYTQARECFEQAAVIASQIEDSFLTFYAIVGQTRTARLLDELTTASELIHILAVDASSSYVEGLFHFENGCCLLASGQATDAISELKRAIGAFAQNERLLENCISQLWLASAYAALEDYPASDEHLTEMVRISKGIKELTPLCVQIVQAHKWIQPAIDHSQVKALLRPLLRHAAAFQEHLPQLRHALRQVTQNVSISAAQLDIHTLGSTRVSYNGKVLVLSDWQTRETRDLFFFFVRATPMTKEEIAAVFWPDISPSRLKLRFKTNMYRLRHAVGQNTILFDNERYRFNSSIDYECDLETFETLIQKAETADTQQETIELLQSAVTLVEGPYLADIDADWVLPERTRIDTLYQSALLRLSELYLLVNQTNRALETSQAALQSDPLLEEAYRIRMRAYFARRNKTAVVREYQRCKEALNEELGIEPSRETKKLYERLTR